MLRFACLQRDSELLELKEIIEKQRAKRDDEYKLIHDEFNIKKKKVQDLEKRCVHNSPAAPAHQPTGDARLRGAVSVCASVTRTAGPGRRFFVSASFGAVLPHAGRRRS